MSDPVAEAAAQLAAQLAEPNLLEKAMGTIHDLEAKVEHLIHPDTPGNEPAVVVESAMAPAIAEEAGTAATGESSGLAADAVTSEVATGDLPNVASDAAEPTTAPDSASNAAGADTTKSTGASSGEDPNVGGTAATATADSAMISTPIPNSASQPDGAPKISAEESASIAAIAEPPLHIRIAEHLEAIYTLARDSAVSTETVATRAAAATKTHIGDVLHRISNGMQVTEGELVQKLEALYRML